MSERGPRAFRTLLVLAIASVTLSGCSSPSSDDPPADSTSTSLSMQPQPLVEGGLVLKAGTAWPFTDEAGKTVTFIVSSLAADTMTIDVDAETEAFREARLDLPFIGNMTLDYVADLAGSPVALLPSDDQMTWMATWSGESRTHSATMDGEGRTTVTVSNDAGPVLTYTFDPELAWFNHIEYAATDQQPAHSLSLAGAPKTATSVVRYSLHTVMSYHKEGFHTGDAVLFDVPDGVTDFWIGGRLACNQPGLFSVTLQMVGSPGAAISESGPCDPTGHEIPGVVASPVPAGRYLLEVYASTLDGSTDADAYLRTLQTISVG